MKESPQVRGVIAATAVVGGLALSRAAATGSTLAWCVTTACGVVIIFALAAAVQYLRLPKGSDQRSEVDAFFEGWPKELDVLVSNADQETRAQAAEGVGAKANLPRWPYRDDALRVLDHVVSRSDTPSIVKTSAIAARRAFLELPRGVDDPSTAANVIVPRFDQDRPEHLRMLAAQWGLLHDLKLLQENKSHRKALEQSREFAKRSSVGADHKS
jgi:hypothetical protein